MGVIDIFIRSYYRDVRWLTLALRALDQFVSGHRRVMVVVPQASHARLDIAVPQSGVNVVVATCADFPDDYVGQQITKLHADLYTDADIIVHLDSDQIFVTACDLRERLFEGGKLKMSASRHGRRPANDGWRRCPEAFFGRAILWDLTIPLPLAMPRHIYSALRAYCVEHYGTSIADYALARRADTFCEMALLRGCAFLQEAEQYHWMNAEHGELLPECRTFWSRRTTPAAIAGILPPCLAEAVCN
jgi:hypothetical protein